MSQQVQEFFTALATRRYEPLLHSVSGTVRWNIEGEGYWNVVINKGAITVNRDAMLPDSVMSCSEDTFLALARGVQNPLTAFLQGKLAIQGNIGLAHVFQRVFENQPGKSTHMASSRRES
ncbi:MAG TPA: SCP2 sterol-binding domain-containing protein [Ktedonobacteraceae bacterium]|nr:SCP2 sterol-binding domain-containing protein [Ktedonobacteraceae bacterium]